MEIYYITHKSLINVNQPEISKAKLVFKTEYI